MKNPEYKTSSSSSLYPSDTFEDFTERWGLNETGLTPDELRHEMSTNPVTKAFVEALAMTDAKAIEQGWDPKTGCLNLNGLEDFLDRRAKLGERAGDILPNGTLIIFVDCDGLKKINDQYGHATGDEAIIAVADRLKAAVRADDLVVRLGGDEFIIIADIFSNEPEEVKDKIIQKVTVAMSNIVLSSDKGEIKATASVGSHYVEGFQPKSVLEASVEEADAKMYERKRKAKLAR